MALILGVGRRLLGRIGVVCCIVQEEVSYVPVVGDVCNVEDNDVFYTATNNLFSCPENKEADG